MQFRRKMEGKYNKNGVNGVKGVVLEIELGVMEEFEKFWREEIVDKLTVFF